MSSVRIFDPDRLQQFKGDFTYCQVTLPESIYARKTNTELVFAKRHHLVLF